MTNTNQIEPFDGDTWKYNALEDLISFKTFHDFVGNVAAVKAYVDSLEYHEGVPELRIENAELSLRKTKKNDVEKALDHYGSQTIVSLCTCYEVAIRDFFRCVFISKPEAMYAFVGPEGAKGHIPLRDVINSASRELLIADLATRSAATATKGGYGQSLERASNLVGAETNRVLTVELGMLQKSRNAIVHERSRESVTLAAVASAHTTIDAGIETMCRIAYGAGIPGNYTCIDHSHTFVIQSIALLGS